MRTGAQVKNYLSVLFKFILTWFFSLFTRNLFVHNLGVDYLGVTGVMANILGMLAIAELGVGSSIIFSLYKPIASGDRKKIHQLVHLYKKLYAWIAGIVLGIGLLLFPFIGVLVPGMIVIPHYEIIYFLYLLNAVIPYFFAYNSTLYTASQQDYKIQNVRTLFYVLTVGATIAILLYFPNYIMLTAVTMALGLGSQVVIYILAHRKWPWLDSSPEEELPKEDLSLIKKNIKSLFLHKVGDYCVNGTANIIIASADKLATVGLLSNYTVLFSVLKSVVGDFFGSMTAGIGELIAKESTQKVHFVFKEMNFLAFWFFGLAAVGFYFCADPLIIIWLGGEFLLPKTAILFLSMDLFIQGMRIPPFIVKSGAGQFSNDKYAPLIQSAVNLCMGLILVRSFGVSGVTFAVMFSGLSVPSWLRPYVLYRDFFHLPALIYFKDYGIYVFFITLTSLIVQSVFQMYTPSSAFFSAVWHVSVVLIVFHVLLLFCFKWMPGGKAAHCRMNNVISMIRSKVNRHA